ncbi:MAG: hypothetical protein LBN00_06550 [Oscillospiraceae bacterium]|jgi:hypothetical protein|nr:hypothetical protein [Oscillospiraceae bacterium]
MSDKEQMLHTLAGDIQSMGMDGISRRGIQNILISRYVRLDTDISAAEFEEMLDEQYEKVALWRKKERA